MDKTSDPFPHLPYLQGISPFRPGPWRLAIGLQPLDLKHWIEIEDQFIPQLHLKDQLLRTRHEDLFKALPESLPGQQAVLDLLVDHLLTHFPWLYQQQDQTLINLPTGQRWRISDFAQAPLDLAGRLVQEDLLLMQPGPEGYRLTAGSLCFPSHWRLQDKLGSPLAQIHQPVPGYAQQLERRVDHLFERLTADRPGWRLNWSLVDTPSLCLCQDTADLPTGITPENVGDRLWLRIERQTLRRIPITQDILFTVHTYLYPLHQVAADPEIASALCTTLQTLPPQTQIYKRLHPIRDLLIQYLQTCDLPPSKA